MAGGERRAEIEAVARALAYNELGRESGWSAYRPQAATVLRYLNRVRDARGDDEGARLFAMRTSTDPAAQAEAHFQSSQGEDHEGLRAAAKRVLEADMRGERDLDAGGRGRVLAAGAAPRVPVP